MQSKVFSCFAVAGRIAAVLQVVMCSSFRVWLVYVQLFFGLWFFFSVYFNLMKEDAKSVSKIPVNETSWVF